MVRETRKLATSLAADVVGYSRLAGADEGLARPGAICLAEDAYRQVRARLDLAVSDLGAIPAAANGRREVDSGLTT